ncbi:hypothetical protein F3J23_03305 [Chryseobacterium sp. Tr-659]|uniref:hypothetical protein n=1 Tax=Chryseobacterium sp. Tr-659 TaxID=2608340 RepID=UPI00142019BE|nr:hypothetical protein [Chryseobacterium sp. Tr-659]NIF04460.1 hypothetical protein [Chryseobacterium sp. Tr-659]
MNSFYKKIGLCDSSRIEVNISSAELIQKLQKITYKTNKTFISLERDTAIPTRFEYRGMIEESRFTIKRRMRLFDVNMNNPVFDGYISDENGQSSVSVEIHPSGIQIFSWIIILCFCFLAIFINIEEQQDIMFLVIASVIAVTQYFVLKRGISRGKYEFERELIYISQKP